MGLEKVTLGALLFFFLGSGCCVCHYLEQKNYERNGPPRVSPPLIKNVTKSSASIVYPDHEKAHSLRDTLNSSDRLPNVSLESRSTDLYGPSS
jgi:hypothetical protein